MKKIILFISTLILLIFICLTIATIYDSKNLNNINVKKQEIKELDSKISSLNKELEKVKVEYDNVKNNNEEDIKILNLWQEKVKEMKNNL